MSTTKLLPKTIYLVGPQSTGKSTLTNALLEYYGTNTPVLFEIARKVLKKKNYSAATITSGKCFEMQRHIFDAQFLAEEKLTKSGQFFISDRNGVDPIVYTMMHSPGRDDWQLICEMEEWSILAQRYQNQKKSLVVLLLPNKEFLKEDGVRRMPQDWKEYVRFGNLFKGFLEDQQIPFKVLDEACSNIQERVDRVVAWAEN